jgi:LPS sulfotransferase NodH
LYSGVWFKRAGDPAPVTPTAPFDLQWVSTLHRRLLAQEAMWREMFASFGVKPLVVDYEDLAESYAGVVKEVLSFLGLDLAPGMTLPPPRLEKQADALTEEIIARYRELPSPSSLVVNE